jgi:hypothetical protein
MEVLNIIKNKTFNEVKDIISKDVDVKESIECPSLYMLVYDNDRSDFMNSAVRNCRGIILEKDTNKVVCYTFNKKGCITVEDSDKIYESIDGTHIKLYYYNGGWHKSTTRCIDAYNAYWYSNKSFGELFDECNSGQINYDILNKEYCYGFVICHKENRIVTKYDENRLVHVCTRNMSKEDFPYIDVDIGVDVPMELSKDCLMEYENNNPDKEGLIVWKDGIHNKIKFESYTMIKNLRVNSNNPLYEYVSNVCSGNKDKYIDVYGERKVDFIDYDRKLGNIVYRLHNSYMDYHVNRIKILGQINKMYWKHMYSLHGMYKRDGNNITKDVVQNYIEGLDAPQVMHMLNLIYS